MVIVYKIINLDLTMCNNLSFTLPLIIRDNADSSCWIEFSVVVTRHSRRLFTADKCVNWKKNKNEQKEME